jgi:hypothetical protein
MRVWKTALGAGCAGAIVLGGNVGPALAEVETHRINEDLLKPGFPSNTYDPETDTAFYTEDTNATGTVGLSTDFGAPAGFGSSALKLTTADDTGKAQALTGHDLFNESLSAVSHVSYYTYSDSSSEFNQANASLQLQVDTNGLDTAGGFTTLVYEPYNNPADNPVLQDQWQFFNATNGNWWSTRAISCVGGLFTLDPGAGGPPFTTPQTVGLACPGSVILQIGVSIGSNAGANTVATDGLRINITGADDSTWNFEAGPK